MAGEARQVAGAIAFDPTTRRVRLEIDDLFEVNSPFDFFAYPAVHGELIDGSPVTLLGCSQTSIGGPREDSDASAASFRCRHSIKGAYLDESDTFARITFALTDLLGWINQRAFDTYSDVRDTIPVFSAATRPTYRASALTDRGEIGFHAAATVEMGAWSTSFSTVASIEIVPDKAVTLDAAFSRFLRPFQDLLTIATGRPQEVSKLQLVPTRNAAVGEKPRDRHDWVDVRFERWGDSEPVGETPFKDVMLFSLSDLDRDLAASLDTWFRLDNEIREVRSLATAAAYRGGMFADQKFLYAAHAIETYHRRRIGGVDRPKADHKRLVGRIVDSVLPEDRAWLRSKLTFSNELSLLNRLQEVRGRVCERVEATLSHADNWEQWTRDTRNYHTHFTQKGRIAKGKQLMALTESILMVLDDMILAELGVSTPARNTLIQRTHRFRLVSQWIAECDWSAP